MHLARFPSEILNQIVPSTHVIPLYTCGDKVLNHKLRRGGGAIHMSIVDHWFNQDYMAIWPSHFLTPTLPALTSFEFVSHQNHDYDTLINASAICLLPRTLKSFKLCVKNAGACVQQIDWSQTFPELQSLIVNNTNPRLMTYPGSLGIGILPPQLCHFESTIMVKHQPTHPHRDPVNVINVLLCMAEARVLPQQLAVLKFTLPQVMDVVFETESNADMIRLVALLPLTLHDLFIDGIIWPIQAFMPSHPIQSLCLDLANMPNHWHLYMPQQLTTLYLGNLQVEDHLETFWSSLPSSLRQLRLSYSIIGRRRRLSIQLPPALPYSLESFIVGTSVFQLLPDFVWPPALHTLQIKRYYPFDTVPLPSSLTNLSITLGYGQANVVLPAQLQMLRLTIDDFAKQSRVLYHVPPSVTHLELISTEDFDDGIEQNGHLVAFDWTPLERLIRLVSLEFSGRIFVPALLHSPITRLPLAPTVKNIKFIGGHIMPGVFEKLPPTLHALDAYIAAKDAPTILSRFTQLRQLRLVLSLKSMDAKRTYFPPYHYMALSDFWTALPHTLEELKLSVAEISFMAYGPNVSVLPPRLRRLVTCQVQAPVMEQPYLTSIHSPVLLELEELQCHCVVQLPPYIKHLPRLKKFVNLQPK